MNESELEHLVLMQEEIFQTTICPGQIGLV